MGLSSAWAARFLALTAGLAVAFAHPPFGLLPGLLGYAALLRAGDTEGPRPLRSAFLRGWLAGLGYFAVAVWWVTEAFMVDAAAHGWMAPFALVFLAGGLALFWGVALLLYRLINARGVWRVLVFAGALAGLEWLRGHILTGFPWNLPGETWRAGSAPSQAASVVGVYGLSWITVALGAAPALLLDKSRRVPRVVAMGLALAALGGLYGFGALRLAAAPPTDPDATRVRIVQANVDQKEKWKPENLELLFSTYESLTRQPAARPIDVVIWPEGALPAVIDDLVAPGSPYTPRLVGMLAPGQTLMMGANRAGLAENGSVDYFNSLVAFRRDGGGLEVTGVYDKYKLVPFGEFLPWGALATRLGIRSLVHMPEDFTAGPPPRSIAPTGLPRVLPLVCYEALFPELARAASRPTGERPSWLLNVSNDAWFGATSGPLQHLNLASYRAIEMGIPMVRSTPTGVSAVIDAFGRTVEGAQLGHGKLGVVDAPLPPVLGETTYSRLGDLLFAFMLVLSGVSSVLPRIFRD